MSSGGSSSSTTTTTNAANNNGGSGGPCGACKFLRRKCLRGCIFAPYFDSDQGTAHFAAVHKVFGASNASKLLQRLPPHKRLDAVVTLCYEALARVRDPVYGCVAHIVTLQQQAVDLQAELAYVHARLATLQCLPPPPPLPLPPQSQSFHSVANAVALPSDMIPLSNLMMHNPLHTQQCAGQEMNMFNSLDQGYCDGEDLHALARQFVSRYLPGVRILPSGPHQNM